jgi:nitrate/TMAO reductase-like tetraheme cytochrome c subunit
MRWPKLLRIYDVKGRAVRVRLRYLILMLVALVFVGVFVVYLPIALTSMPSFCGRCHTMTQAVDQWKHSTHANVNCVACHVDPGITKSLEHKVLALKEVYDELFGSGKMPSDIRQPKNSNCLQCHNINRTISPSGDIKIPHQEHVVMQGLNCTDCHFTVVHSLRGTPGAPPPMDVCYMCHDGVKAPNACSTCHVNPPSLQEAHPTDALTSHGKQALANPDSCSRCHSPASNFCENCHSKPPASHQAADWRYTHKTEVAAKGRDVCLGCHTQDFCNTCHTVNHPADWLQVHGQAAVGGIEPCLVCHSTGFCNACHQTTKGLPIY